MATGKKVRPAPPTRLETARQAAYLSPVLIFKRILNFKSALGIGDKRDDTRHPVGAKFPLKARLTLAGRDADGLMIKGPDNHPMDWSGQLIDMSSGGLSLRLHPAAIGERGEKCRLRLEFAQHVFETDTQISHYRPGKHYAACGLALKFSDSHAEKAYRQLVEPVAIGSGLEPKKVKQDAPDLKKEQYADGKNNVLNVWRERTGKFVEQFELLTDDYFIRGGTQSPDLQVGYQDGVKVGAKVSSLAQPISLPSAQVAEVRQLFQLIVPNLPKTVPPEVHAFLERFAR